MTEAVQKRLVAKISSCPNKRMEGAELARLIRESGLSWDRLLDKMTYWNHHSDIARRIKLKSFELEPEVMQTLLDALGANSL